MARPRSYEEHMGERFVRDILDNPRDGTVHGRQHVLTVLHDEDEYKHLHFKKRGTGMYWFDIVVWPGTLAIRGDMGNFMFARVRDMMGFFRGQSINPQYWAEKEVTGAPTRQYSAEVARERVLEAVSSENLEWQGWSTTEKREIRKQAQLMVRSEDFSHLEGYRYLVDAFVVPFFAEESGQGYREFRFSDTWDWNVEEWTAQYLWCCYAIAWGIAEYDDRD